MLPQDGLNVNAECCLVLARCVIAGVDERDVDRLRLPLYMTKKTQDSKSLEKVMRAAVEHTLVARNRHMHTSARKQKHEFTNTQRHTPESCSRR